MSSRSKKKSKPSGPSAPLSDALQECYDILKFLQSRDDAQPFLEPVDWELYGLHDYPEVVTHPMDLGSIQSKLEEGRYKDPQQFAADVRLVWDNCLKYNMPNSDLYMTAQKLATLFDKKFTTKFKPSSSSSAASSSSSPSSSSKSNSSSSKPSSSGASAPEASRADRLKLCQLVNQLSPEQLGVVVEMVQRECPEALNEEEEEEIEIEVNNIDGATMSGLIAFAQQCLNGGPAEKKQKTK